MSEKQNTTSQNDATIIERVQDDVSATQAEYDIKNAGEVGQENSENHNTRTLADEFHQQKRDESDATFIESNNTDQTALDFSLNQLPSGQPDKTVALQEEFEGNRSGHIFSPPPVDITLGEQDHQESDHTSGTVTADNKVQSSKTGNQASSRSDQTVEFDHSRKPKPENSSSERTIGRFEIVKLLGEGAFGKVYLGKDVRLDRELAIKVAKTGVLNAREDVDRFQREARAAARLRHPNIVPVHEAGTIDKSSYIAYDFVRGTTIKQILKDRTRLPQRECAQLLSKIASALNYAHEQGIIHRDIKPENIIVDEKHEPHVLDFGLARGTDLDVTHTREGAMMGSPAYMSPEQASGMSHLADERSDIWSLGVMMYEMLAGVRPFLGNVAEVIISVRNKEAAPLNTIVPGIDLDLVTICDKCLRKDPKERFSSAGEMAEELERWLRGEPIISRPLDLWSKTVRWARRNPTVARLIGGVCLSLFIGALTSGYFAYQAIKEKRIVIQTRKERDLAQLDNLVSGVPAIFPQSLEVLKPYAMEVTPKLKEIIEDQNSSPSQRLRSRTALLTIKPEEKLEEAEACLLICHEYQMLKPDDILAVRKYLTPVLGDFKNHLWQEITNVNIEPARRFTAGAFLADLDQNETRWEQIASDIVGQLLVKPNSEIHDWVKLLKPVENILKRPLELKFLNAETERERITSATVIAALYPNDVELLTNLLVRGNSAQFPALMEPVHKHQDSAALFLTKTLEQPLEKDVSSHRIAELMRQKGNAACALIGLDKFQTVRPFLKQLADPRIRTHVIHESSLSGILAEKLIRNLPVEKDPDILAALLAALSQFGTDNLLESDRRKILPVIQNIYNNTMNSSVLSHIEYLMNKWRFEVQFALWQQEKKEIADSSTSLSWTTNKERISFAVIPSGVEYLRGSPETELGHAVGDIETLYKVNIPRSFALSTKEITVAQFLKFKPDFEYEKEFSPVQNCPIHSVSWIDAAKYCRWLSEQEKIPESEMCYPEINKISAEMKLPENFLTRSGYRLPTSSEWEYASRGGSALSRCYGLDEKLLPRYAWFNSNGDNHTHPAGTLLPNAFGLFDMHGNLLEWTHDYYFDVLPPLNEKGIFVDDNHSRSGSSRELRGGHFESPHLQVRCADREEDVESKESFYIGFRIAKTIKK